MCHWYNLGHALVCRVSGKAQCVSGVWPPLRRVAQAQLEKVHCLVCDSVLHGESL